MMKKRDYRPKIHFSPEKGWMNDPNGMVYVDGVYHFFYQKYPYDTSWGPMHWGHATSRDLIHWEHQPIALYPDELGFIFSGSAVYDTQNSSEYGTNENPPIIAIYTSHHKDGLEQQSIAYSNDKGRHFEKSYLNPVIKNPGISDFRDPKAFWNPVRRCWSLVLAAQDRVFFYASQDMKNWEKTGEFGPEGNHVKGVWECPDLFPIEYKGKNVWVLVVSMTKASEDDHCKMQYFLGDFDGEKFLCTYPSDEPRWLDEGFDNYAAVTFQNAKDVLLMGWGMNWQYAAQTPTEEYCGQATLARKLSLTEVDGALTLVAAPAGLEKFRHSSYPIENHTTIRTETFGMKVSGKGDAKICLKNSVGQKLKIYVTDTKITVDRTMAGYKEFSEHFMTEKYSISTAARKKDGAWNLELVFDVSILELFAEDGVDAISTVVYPETPYDRISWKGDLSVELYEIDA